MCPFLLRRSWMPFKKFSNVFKFSVSQKKLHCAFFLVKNQSICFNIKRSMNRITKVGDFNKTQKKKTNEREINTNIKYRQTIRDTALKLS